MLKLSVENWQYLHSGPLFSASIKTELSDFEVIEHLSFEPSGDGEHTFLYIEKTGLNTAYVAEEIAKFAQLPLRAVSYAGRKDKYATTRQWFGIYSGGKHTKPKTQPDWNTLSIPGVKLLEHTNNQRKLRTGAIKSNQFVIVMRDIFDESTAHTSTTLLDYAETQIMPRLQARLALISKHGAPNYYGNQRFGEMIKADGSVQLGGNLSMAERLINGEEIRNRNKRSMAISALRSWLFNQAVSHRLSHLDSNHLLNGDALALSGTNSFFIYDQNAKESEHIPTRIAERDVNITAPLWGKGSLDTKSAAFDFEQAFAENNTLVCKALAELGLEQQRRALLIHPTDLQANLALDNNKPTITLSFGLPSGCFATSVLREIAEIKVGA